MFDGLAREDVETFPIYLENLGYPTNTFVLTTEAPALKDRLKKRQEIDELGEEAEQEFDQ